jgi:DNA helicase IV
VSREYLESTFAERMRQLADDPSIPLFFGRLDYGDDEDFHIGRRHITNDDGDPMVVDWRAPVSLPFYRATRADPMDVARRRRFGFQHGALTALEDEDLATPAADTHSAILEAEIERPRTGPMRDIVATIQPDQDVIVRSELPSACTGRRTSSTPIATGCTARGSSSSGPTPASCATSPTCCPRSARSRPGRPPSRNWPRRRWLD